MKREFLVSSRFLVVAFAISSMMLASCHKEVADAVTVGGKSNDGPVPTYWFDWTTQTYMPSSLTSDNVPMPWNSGTTPIDPDIASDYLPADGWKLAWSSFSPTQPISGSQNTMFFALYNKFRGLLRFYLWQPPSLVATTYVAHGLDLYNPSATSPMLNFNNRTIIDNTTNQTSFSGISSRQFNTNGGTWYVFQYEMAYDPNIPNTYFTDPSVPVASTQALEWKSQWVNITTGTIDGHSMGTITGTLGEQQTPISSLISALSNAGVGALQLYGLSDVPLSPNDLYKNALGGALGGSITNVFNGLIAGLSGGGGNSNAVNLTFDANITLNANLVNSGGLEDIKLILPGQANAQTGNGLTPYYNDGPMGVFNVVGIPQVHSTQQSFSQQIQDPYDGSNQTDYGVTVSAYLDANSVNLITNPTVINSSSTGASIVSTKYELLLDEYPYTYPVSGNYTSEGSGTWSNQGNNLPSYLVYANTSATNPAVYSYYTQMDSNEGGYVGTPQVYVRVTLVIQPNGSTKTITLFKTFLAALTN